MNHEFRLWTADAPGALGNKDVDIPTLTPFLPKESDATGAAMIILPGGGYGHLAEHEGAGYATWLAKHGIAAFVLRYRLGTNGYRHPSMLHDAARAMRFVRSRAKTWDIDPKRIGVMGSSAGGHLAATLLTHYDEGQKKAMDPIERASSRPSLGILCYPVITMAGADTHEGCRKHLLGDTPAPELLETLSTETQVTADTPPCFLFHTWEDASVKVSNSLLFATALQKHGVPFDLHIYQKGRHGIGMGTDEFNPTCPHPWTNDCLYWLKTQKFIR